jgi:ATP adenylyltransferase
MERLFRPWRMAYVSGPKTGAGPGSCFLCEAVASTDDAANLVVFRGERAIVLLNRYPYNSGHVMVVPKRHIGDLEALDEQERAAIMELVTKTVVALKAEMAPDGCNVGLNLGRAAGAGAPDHLHVHAVPRWNGDTNFMPVLGDTMVLPEALEATREKLARRFAGEGA